MAYPLFEPSCEGGLRSPSVPLPLWQDSPSTPSTRQSSHNGSSAYVTNLEVCLVI